MPIPTPRAGESKNDFVSRCMGDSVMASDYPNGEQRSGVCHSQWDKRVSLGSMSLDIGSMTVDIRPDEGVGFTTISAATAKDNQPHQLFRKELVRTGHYVKASSGQEFTITADMLRHWVATFHRMKKNGVDVPIPNSHQAAGRSDDNRGFVRDMFVDGESLVGVCELIGNDALKAAARNNISIHSEPELIDGNGNKYLQPILHAALTPEPLAPGLGGFITIEASRRLENSMDPKAIAKLLGLGDVTPEEAGAKITAAIKQLQSKLAEAQKKTKTLSASRDDGKDGKDGKDDKGKEKGSTDLIPKALVTPAMLSMARRNREMQLDGLVKDGKIDKNTRDELTKEHCADENLTMALQATDDRGTAFDRLVGILGKNQPVSIGETTGPQTITLADGTKADASDVLVRDAEERAKEAAEMVRG